ncbi:hypothetical protein TorRG33x02_119160 [Trema orientale]|uniref:Uncharacterized protein n=1 Tax=Trema orientale TaxID=63057 RepID=A0A2P5F3B2_TREOI|nr:hypothetical protein TorRG33x02_119160 [Trema orientale]
MDKKILEKDHKKTECFFKFHHLNSETNNNEKSSKKFVSIRARKNKSSGMVMTTLKRPETYPPEKSTLYLSTPAGAPYCRTGCTRACHHCPSSPPPPRTTA